MKKTFSLLTLLLLLCTSAWANQTTLIDGFTLPDIPNGTLNLSSQTDFTPDANGWIVFSPKVDISGKNYWTSSATNGNSRNWTIPNGSTAPFKGGTSKSVYALQKARCHALRFTGAEKLSCFLQGNSSSKKAHAALYSYDGEDQTEVDSKEVAKTDTYNGAEVLFDGLNSTTNYIVYFYGDETSNSDLLEVALKASTTPTLTGAWKISSTDVTGTTTNVVQEGAATMPTFTVGATSGTPTTSNYNVVYSETGTAGIFTYEDGVPTGISTSNAGSATITATLTTKDASKYLTPATNTFQYTVSVSAASAPESISVTANATSVYKNADVTLTASVTGGVPTPTIHWYSCTNAEKAGASEIVAAQGEETYSPSTAALGTYYFYAVASNGYGDDVSSDVVTITINGHSDCKLYQAKYSNHFNAFIDESAKTVKVYYLDSESAPTINSSSIEVSTGATVDYSNANQIVVTAEDETTSATYTVTRTPVTPYSGAVKQFNGTEDWIKTGGAYTGVNGSKTYHAWVINRQLKPTENKDDDPRVALGKTRIYFFVDNATNITLTNYAGSALSSARAIKVYVNGTEDGTVTSMPKYAGSPVSITITTGAVAMVEISSNQDGGDTGWGKITVSGAQENTEAVSTLTDRNYASYVTLSKLNFADASVASDITAYIATGFNDNKDAVVLQKVNVVDAGTPIIVKTTAKGATANVPITTAEADVVSANKLVAGDGSTAYNGTSGYTYFYLASDLFHKATEGTLQKGKAYLKVATEDAPAAPSAIRIVDEENTATSIDSIESVEEGVKFIQNGQLYIKKNNVVYDMMGTVVH